MYLALTVIICLVLMCFVLIRNIRTKLKANQISAARKFSSDSVDLNTPQQHVSRHSRDDQTNESYYAVARSPVAVEDSIYDVVRRPRALSVRPVTDDDIVYADIAPVKVPKN
jgi:hypothetical protein